MQDQTPVPRRQDRTPAMWQPAPRRESDEIVLSSPMSFVGSAQRIWRAFATIPANIVAPWPRRIVTALVVALDLTLITLVWTFLLGWYVLAFGVFGFLVIPWRFHQRSQRRALQEQIRLRETIEAAQRQVEPRA